MCVCGRGPSCTVCMCVCVRACVRACVRVCVCVHVYVRSHVPPPNFCRFFFLGLTNVFQGEDIKKMSAPNVVSAITEPGWLLGSRKISATTVVGCGRSRKCCPPPNKNPGCAVGCTHSYVFHRLTYVPRFLYFQGHIYICSRFL